MVAFCLVKLKMKFNFTFCNEIKNQFLRFNFSVVKNYKISQENTALKSNEQKYNDHHQPLKILAIFQYKKYCLNKINPSFVKLGEGEMSFWFKVPTKILGTNQVLCASILYPCN